MSEQAWEMILQEMRHGFASVNGRLDQVDQRLGKVEVRLEAVDQRLDKVETRLDNVETVVMGVKQMVMEVQQSVNRIEEVQEQHTAAIESLRQERKMDRRLLEALTVKYFEHDADIRELKHA